MKIAFLSVLFRHPAKGCKVGGGEISNRCLLEALALKHDVCVISATGNGLWGEKINGVTYYDTSSSGALKRAPRLVRNTASKVAYKYSVPRLLKKLSPDVVLCATLEYNPAIAYGRAHGVPVGAFIRAFENFEHYNVRSSKETIKRYCRAFLYGNTQDKAISCLDFLLPNSDFMEERCKKFFKVESTYVIYPPVDLERKKPHPAPDRKHPNIKKIMMVSGAKKKGGDIFIGLSECFPDVAFFIIGYRGDLSSQGLPANLKLHGWVGKPEKCIAEADLVLVPSVWEEPFGRIAVEALQCGTPVLVSDIGGLPETVAYQKFLRVEPGNLSAWREKLSLCLAYSGEFVDATLKAMESATSYSLESQIQALEAAMYGEIEKKRL